jgi:hypothetical protein
LWGGASEIFFEVMDPRAANPDVFLQAYLSIGSGGQGQGGAGLALFASTPSLRFRETVILAGPSNSKIPSFRGRSQLSLPLSVTDQG